MVETNERLDEELRQYSEHTAKLTPVLGKLDTVLRTAFDRHRAEFVKKQAEHYLQLPTRFLAERKPNETAEEWVKRDMGWPANGDQTEPARNKREKIIEFVKHYEGVAFWLTTHPVHSTRFSEWGSFKPEHASPGAWKDADTRDQWVDAADQRKPFKVKLRDDAAELATKHAEQVAERVVKVFTYKAVSKVLPIIKRNKVYFAQLQKVWFGLGGIEADVRVTFNDTRSFVFHVVLKQNFSSLGTPYWQYPLTFQDVYGGMGQKPVKSLPQADVEALFGVTDEDRWAPTIVPEKKPRWRSARAGDVVKFHKKKAVGLILGHDKKKKTRLRVQLADGQTVLVDEGRVESVVTRIEIGWDLLEKKKDGKDLFTYTLLNQDWTVEGPTFLNKQQSKTLEQMYYGTLKGSHRLEGARMAFEVLCGQNRFPGSAKKEAVPA